ncbi:UNVERIFIED_CONTAM: hypothetical protein Cloal_1146 [Acetivibrio alkalicellulosi]
MENFAKEIKISAPVRMRTQAQALAEVKAIDPNTALTAHALRQLVLQRKIKVVMAGNKYLINFDSLLDYLVNPTEIEPDQVDAALYGKLRKIHA